MTTDVRNAGAERFCGGRPLLTWSRRNRLRGALGARTLLLYRLECEDSDGRVVESSIVPLLVDERLADAAGVGIPAPYVERWRRRVDEVVAPFQTARITRARAIASIVSTSPISLFQPALFDRRAEHAQQQTIRHRTCDADDANAWILAIGRQGIVGNPTARLQLIIRP
jgi:hypothetical protein